MPVLAIGLIRKRPLKWLKSSPTTTTLIIAAYRAALARPFILATSFRDAEYSSAKRWARSYVSASWRSGSRLRSVINQSAAIESSTPNTR